VGFRPNLTKLTNLNFKAWKFYKTFINELDRDQCRSVIDCALSALKDSVIATAIRRLPAPVYQQTGATIEHKLKKRRDDLAEAGMRYYYFLSSSVRVNGSDGSELFAFRAVEDGVHLSVYNLERGEPRRIIYSRTFKDEQTDDITLTALGGNDRFSIAADVSSRIRVHIWGGKGADTYEMKGKMRSTIHDSQSDGNQVDLNSYSKLHNSSK
jgi:hypothetical protein